MAYAEGRTYFDADSHIMELPDFLREFADPAQRERIPLLTAAGGGRSSRAEVEQLRADVFRVGVSG